MLAVAHAVDAERDLLGDNLAHRLGETGGEGRLVDRLASRGLVTKIHDPEDGRGTIVAITEEGFELFRRVAYTHVDAITRHVGNSLSDVELREIVVFLSHYVGWPNGARLNSIVEETVARRDRQ